MVWLERVGLAGMVCCIFFWEKNHFRVVGHTVLHIDTVGRICMGVRRWYVWAGWWEWRDLWSFFGDHVERFFCFGEGYGVENILRSF